MTVGVLIVSNNKIGEELVNSAHQIMASSPLPIKVISITVNDDVDSIAIQLKATLRELDQGNGILVLTDMYGSTPSNIACRVSGEDNVKIVSGLNLPMLISVLNYPSLTLEQLAEKAWTSGREAIAHCHQS